MDNPKKNKRKILVTQALPYANAPLHLGHILDCLLYTSPSPRDSCASRMPSSA